MRAIGMRRQWQGALHATCLSAIKISQVTGVADDLAAILTAQGAATGYQGGERILPGELEFVCDHRCKRVNCQLTKKYQIQHA